jgi:hypothetical protein
MFCFFFHFENVRQTGALAAENKKVIDKKVVPGRLSSWEVNPFL